MRAMDTNAQVESSSTRPINIGSTTTTTSDNNNVAALGGLSYRNRLKSKMKCAVQTRVSGDRHRFDDSRHNLDLTYITKRLIGNYSFIYLFNFIIIIFPTT